MSSKLEESLKKLSVEAEELYLDSEIPIIEGAPTSLEFLRNYVSLNKPVVIKGAIDRWPAVHAWTNNYLRDKIGNKEVSVAVTPNGYADAVVGDRFVMPEERQMTISQFLDIMEGKVEANGIFYIQKQNSSLTLEFEELVGDIEKHIPWATEAFGKMPDAINFWMGDGRAVTSLHKDHYENLYCVMSGKKTFTLIPPTDQAFVYYDEFQVSVFKENDSCHFEIIDDLETGKVPWISIDPLNVDLLKYPLYRHAHPVTIVLEAGDMLYLPSLWFHHVQQSHGCIAVNFWYDMEYDVKYVYYKFVESVIKNVS